MDPQLQALSAQLAESAFRNTAQLVADRITAARARREDRQMIAELEQIVSELIADKAEIVRIAQAYESELVAQRISNEDVEYISANILPVIRKLAEQGAADEREKAEEMIDLLTPVLSVETVRVLQLLGFNFRQALGQPMTELVSRAILSKSAPEPGLAAEVQALQIKREMAYLQVAQDPEAYERLGNLLGQS